MAPQGSQIRQESSPAALINVSRGSDGFHSSWGSVASVQRAQNPAQLTAYQQTVFSNPFAQPGLFHISNPVMMQPCSCWVKGNESRGNIHMPFNLFAYMQLNPNSRGLQASAAINLP